MKKLVVLSAVVLGMAMSANAEATLETLWRVTDGLSIISGNSRQAVGHDGKFYLTHTAAGVPGGYIEVWDKDGNTGKQLTAGTGINGINITSDDAGNIIASMVQFNGSYNFANGDVFIYNPATDESKVTTLGSAIKAGRQDMWGHVKGDVLSEEGGLLVFGGSASTQFDEAVFKNGAYVAGGQQGIKDNYWYSEGITFSTTGIASVYDWLPNEMAMATKSDSPVYHWYYDKSGDVWVWRYDGEYYTPERNICIGFALFQIGEQTYIVYSRGGNNADGIVVAKAVVKKNGEEAMADPSELIVVKTFGDDTKFNGSVYNWFNVEVVDGVAMIYQYCAGNFMAVHSFTPDNTTTSIAAVEASENAPVEYFNLQGIRVNNPENGIFIRRQGNKVTKVVK